MSADLPTPRASLPLRAHRLSLGDGHTFTLYQGGPGRGASTVPPLLAVHSVNAAASAFEMMPLVMDQANERPALAIDLPGFGQSDRPDIAYTPRLMREAIAIAVHWIRLNVSPLPIDLVALSLGGEFAAEAVLERPHRYRSLTLISPTGMESRRVGEKYEGGQTRAIETLRRLLRSGALGVGVYRALTTKASMRWFLSRMWGHSGFDPRLLTHGRARARQRGAHRAPLDFVAGALFTRGVIERYRELPVPMWVVHGTRGAFTDIGACPSANGAAGARFLVTTSAFDSGAMPHFEQPFAFNAAFARFLDTLAQGGTSLTTSVSPSAPSYSRLRRTTV